MLKLLIWSGIDLSKHPAISPVVSFSCDRLQVNITGPEGACPAMGSSLNCMGVDSGGCSIFSYLVEHQEMYLLNVRYCLKHV